MHDGITGYIFINSVINVRQNRSTFKRLNLLIPQPMTLKKLKERSWELFREITGGFTYVPLKLCGFFKVKTPREIGKNKFAELYPINNIYAYGHRVSHPFSFYVYEDDIITEPTSGVMLLNDPASPDSENLKRVREELFFFDPDIVTAAKYQITGFDPTQVNEFNVSREFERGENIKTSPAEKLAAESPLVVATLERIIASLFWVLQNENHPKFKSKSSIYQHLETHFKGVKGLKGNYIKEFIKSAEEDLREKEEENGISLTYLERNKNI